MTNRIAALRKERRLSQAELADALEVTRQTIISLESGRYNASLLLAHKIAKYFDLTIED
ncbi:MAG: helix-turn-helix transcriptional regulator, partial [Oscillospiraceae bacterium]|nr:helix-turn-helix transcriptional regulator [Oscillospiraceae bacterium]